MNSKIRILHASTPLSWRGGEQQIAYLASALLAKGHPQKILCPISSKMEHHCQELEIPYATAQKASGLRLSYARSLKSVAQELSADIIHLHDSHAHSAALLACKFLRLRIPLVLSRRVDFPIKDNFISRSKYNSPYINKIICVSNAIRDVLAPSIQDLQKLSVIHDGVDTNRFSGKQATGKLHQELGIPAPIRIIGNTSAISDEKDYDTFLDIAAHLTKSRSDIVFVIIGEGEKRAHIEERIQTENLAQSVFLTGYRTDIPDILPELDIFLMPSKTEGLGSSLIDAMACRVPIVSTYAGGIPELITHKSTGMLAPIGDAKALSEHITQILDDPGLDQRLTENAYAQLDRFNTETMAHKTEAVYRSILDLGSSSERV